MSYEEEKQDRKIEQLEAEIERLRAELASANVELMAAGETVRAKEARIEDLEDALVEVRARSFSGWVEESRVVWDVVRQQFWIEGKIGPEDATPKIKRCYSCGRSLDEIDCDNFTCCDCAPSWQITDERKAVIQRSAELFEEDASELEGEEYSGAYAARQKSLGIAIVLRAMLEGAGQ